MKFRMHNINRFYGKIKRNLKKMSIFDPPAAGRAHWGASAWALRMLRASALAVGTMWGLGVRLVHTGGLTCSCEHAQGLLVLWLLRVGCLDLPCGGTGGVGLRLAHVGCQA